MIDMRRENPFEAGILSVFNVESDRRALNVLGKICEKCHQPHVERAVGFLYIFDGYTVNTVVCRRHRRGGFYMADSIEQAMKNAKASLELSGFKVEDYHTELVRKVLTGEMTNEEFLKEAKRMAQERGGEPK